MPLRVRIEIRSRHGSSKLEAIALVNTGFTSETPDLAIPVAIAEKLGLWPPPGEALSITLETGGGVVESYVVPQAVVVKIVTEDRCSREIVANTIVNPYLEEVLISDCLAEELGIQILYPRRGLWKFVDEDRVRESV